MPTEGPGGAPRICRIYPRMWMGGVENAVLQYLEHTGSTHMVVSHSEGLRAPRARQLAQAYTKLDSPRLPGLMRALRGAEVAHLHTINDHPLAPIAAQLAGVPVIVQTLHNHFSPRISALVDHTICVGRPLLDLLPTPARASFLPNGVPCAEVLPPFAPWYAEGRPLRVLELRREDKVMDVPLEAIARTGAFDGMPVEMRVAGFHRDAGLPHLQHLGPLSDPYPEVARADLVVHGSRFDTFGRVVYEAMAFGSLPVTVDNPVFTGVFSAETECFFFSTRDVETSARELRRIAEALVAEPGRYEAMRRANHARVQREFTVPAMVRRTVALYAELAARGPGPRSFGPADLQGVDLAAFGAVLDDILDRPAPRHPGRLGSLPPRAAGIAAWLLVDQGRVRPVRKRLELLQLSAKLLGDRPAVCLSLAQELAAIGQKDGALTWYARALQGHPHHVVAWLEAVTLNVELGRLDAAGALMQEALRHNPGVSALTGAAARLGVQ